MSVNMSHVPDTEETILDASTPCWLHDLDTNSMCANESTHDKRVVPSALKVAEVPALETGSALIDLKPVET